MSLHMKSDRGLVLGISTLCLTALVSPALADIEVHIPLPGHDGQTRRMLLHLPSGSPDQDPFPIVLGFHGGFGDAESFRSLTELHTTADARGFGVAYMDAGDGVWGDYRPGPGQPDADLAYVNAAIDYLVANHNADPNRFYATGISNGGAFSFVLGAELPHRIAAIAPVAHNLSQSFVDQATPGGPMHVLQIVGNSDPLMPFNGGTQGQGDVVLSSDATMDYWSTINGNGPSSISFLPNVATDGTTAFQETFAPSVLGVELERIVVLNGGHTWPGGGQYLPESVIGLTSRDFSANDVVLDFFSDKALPIPSPSGVAVLGAGGLVAARRRRAPCNWERTSQRTARADKCARDHLTTRVPHRGPQRTGCHSESTFISSAIVGCKHRFLCRPGL